MRKMKDSGIQWIGEIPEGWEVKKLKFVFDMHFSGVWGNIPGENEVDTVCIRVADFDYPKLSINFHDAMTIRSYKLDEIKLFSLKHGDILIEKSGGGEITPVGRSVVFEKNSIMMCANFIGCLRPKEELNYRFMNYWLYSAYIYGYSKRNVKQTTGIQNLDLQSFLNEFIAVCKENEQQHIADYLDNKCAQIDSIIDAKEKTNEKLKEYRQSIIYEAVTKGLNKNAPMKDSGVEWIGVIPEGWEVKRFRYIYNIIGGNGFKEHLQGREKGDYPFYKVSDINESGIYVRYANNYVDGKDIAEQNFNIIPRNSLLIAKIGEALKKNHRKVSTTECVIDNNMQALVPIENINSLYFYYQWLCIDMIWFDNGGTIPSVNNTNLKSFYLVYPGIEAQQQIAKYLDDKCSQIDSVISANEKIIEKLKEYRQSIIYEAVTGKIEV